jgi:hypothetical protein
LDDLSRHKALVESQANLIQIQDTQAERAVVRNNFAMIEEQQHKNNYLAVINWLSAVDSILDQETSSKVRQDYPSTGKWVLQDAKNQITDRPK